MAFKKFASSPKLYVILLILATALLIFIGSISYKQISELRASANSITHTLEVEKEINNLFFVYSRMESAELKNLLKKDTLQYSYSFQKYLNEADSSLNTLKTLVDDNPIQLNHLVKIGELQNDLVKSLKDLSRTPQTRRKFSLSEKNKIDPVAHIMAELSQRKNFMLNKEDALLKERKKKYESKIFFTPLMILFLGIFALFIFVISFLKINSEREKRSKAEGFLESIMFHAENIINFYEPIFGKEGEIIDFKLKYANERNRIDFGLAPKDIIGKRISKIFPFILLNGEYEKFILSFHEKKTFKLSRQVLTNGKNIWLESTIRPLNNGILVIAKNITNEKDSLVKLNALNNKLQVQYEELQDTEAFLQSILTSTNNVISHYKPIRDSQKKKIIDFSIVYTNDVITEATGNIPEDIKGKKISEVYPFLMHNGVFDIMVQTLLTGEILKIEREYDLLGVKKVFLSTATKLEDGVTLTSRENTLERLAEQQMKEVNKKLKIQNTILRDAEVMAGIGSYRINKSENKIELSENFYRLLNSKSSDFELIQENFKEFIHPDDLHNYELQIKNASRENKSFTVSYRVVTKNKKIKHFRTSAHFENDVLVGVVQDVTNLIKGEQKLKEKNQELKLSNEELESFNSVASHDLQEPIRKIQMFISRIADTDLENLSDRSKEYFAKINTSSERMRMLIKYLLSYSKINKTKKDFEKINLALILEKVLEDQEARIKESGVAIVIDNLPVLNAIPFQMEQLFNNLISNAIKYRTLEDPKIIIDCKKLKRSQITFDFIKKSKYYYRISVLDNGIGFDQEYSEKIFELFQRLHQKNEYSGTGIGLAICKKIVQNHNGHIIAESEAGKGTSFCVYLPA